MKIRTIGNWLLILGSFVLLWSAGSRQLCAGQKYQRQVRVFGQSPAATAPSQKVDPAEAADIRQLMDLMRTKATFTRMMNTMEQNMRPLMLRALPPGAYRQRLVELFIEKFRAEANPQHLMDMAVPIYAEYLSDTDVKGLIQFYKTPLGQKWVGLQPKVMSGLLPESHAWGQEIGRQAMLEVLQEHPDLAQQLRAAREAAHQR